MVDVATGGVDGDPATPEDVENRIAARILLREESAKLTKRDITLGRKLAADSGVTTRLIDQAINGIRGKKLRLERERRAAA